MNCCNLTKNVSFLRNFKHTNFNTNQQDDIILEKHATSILHSITVTLGSCYIRLQQ